MKQTDKNYKIGMFFLFLSIVFMLSLIYLIRNNLISLQFIYFIFVGILLCIISLYYLTHSKRYQTTYKKKCPKVSSYKELIKRYYGRGAILGIIFGLLMQFPLFMIILSMIVFEVMTLVFFYFIRYRKPKRK